jgi:uncharacterized protein (UPF0261 family)
MNLETQYILLIGCFDTKGEDFAFLRQCIISLGEKVIAVNTGVLGTTSLFPVDVEAENVAFEAGVSIQSLREEMDRGHAVEMMGKGAAVILANLVREGKIKAAIGMGGGGGTFIALSAMQEIPLGIPKLCLTTLAAKDLSRQIGAKDITLMPSIVDIAGLNSISRHLIKQAAAAICAMSKVENDRDARSLGRVAISMFGNTTTCVSRCSELLRKEGYEVFAFHATGIGGKTMESLIMESCFDAVLDITTTELADELCGGICSAGPDRLNAAADKGIPQVVVPGCLDMVNFAQLDTVPEIYRSRKLYNWAPDVTLMRTNVEENKILGRRLAGKLNASQAATVIVLPNGGLSQIDAQGEVFYDPEATKALFEAIRAEARADVEITEVDANINDLEFADLLVQKLLQLLGRRMPIQD